MIRKIPPVMVALSLAAAAAYPQSPSPRPRPVPGIEPAIAAGPAEALAWTSRTAAGERVVAAVPAAGPPRRVGPAGSGSDGAPALRWVGDDLLLVATRRNDEASTLWSRVRRDGRWRSGGRLVPPTPEVYSPALAAGTRSAWLVWIGVSQGGRSDLYAARWQRGAWSPPERLPRTPGGASAPAVSLDRAGRPMVVWVASDGVDSEIWFSRRRRAGWDDPRTVSRNGVPDAQPAIGADARGRAVVAWASFEPDGYRPWVARERPRGFLARRLDRHTGSSPSVIGGATPRVVWAVPEGERTTRLRDAAWIDGRWREGLIEGRFHARFAASGRDGEVVVAWPDEDGVETAHVDGGRATGARPIARALAPHPSTRAGGTPTLPGTWRGFGDSITVGTMTVEESTVNGEGYVVPLQTTLSSYTGLEIIVVQSGVGGEVTPDGLGRLAGLMIGDPRLYTFIHEGTNDVTGIAENEDVVNNLEAMAKVVTQAGCIPFLSNLLPRPPGDSQGLNDRVDSINALLPEVALRQSAVHVDLWSAFNEQWQWFSDNVHPNSDGYQVMASTWFASLRPILNGIQIDTDGTRDRDRDPLLRLPDRNRGASIRR